MLILNHIIAFSLGFAMDLVIGDPYSVPHPIRLIGSLIHRLDMLFMEPCMKGRDAKREKAYGLLTVILVLIATMVLTALVMLLSYALNRVLGIVVEAVLSCYVLAATSLKRESMKVYRALKAEDIEAARFNVSMIVGRDTRELSEAGIARATIETIAENTSDGVIAPMLYLCLFGPVIAMAYKAVNTMDSMIGYHNDRYESYGFFAARLDDAVNFIPARISAYFMILASYMSRGFDGKNALCIFRRDRFNHKSPNSAQTESVCAGAMGLRLGGPSSYFGRVVEKPYIGTALREVEAEDIKRANSLMLRTVMLLFVVCELFMGALLLVMIGLR